MSARVEPINKKTLRTAIVPPSYIIGYALFVLSRCYLMFSDPKPIRISTAIAAALFFFMVLLMLFTSKLRLEYAILVTGMLVVELVARDTEIRWLFIMQAAMAILLAVLALRRKGRRR